MRCLLSISVHLIKLFLVGQQEFPAALIHKRTENGAVLPRPLGRGEPFNPVYEFDVEIIELRRQSVYKFFQFGDIHKEFSG